MIRRLSTSLLTIVALVSVVNIVCQAQSQSPLTHHVREVTLNGQAQYVGPLPATQSMRLVLVLPLRNQAELDNFLKELYDPSSPSYRQFLTVEEFTARFGPSQEDYDAVIRFAETQRLYSGRHFAQSPEPGCHGFGGDHRESLPCDHGRLPAPHRKPHLLRSGPRAHAGPLRFSCGTSRAWTTIRSRIPRSCIETRGS